MHVPGRPVVTDGLLRALTDAVLAVRADVVVAASAGADDHVGPGGHLVGLGILDLVHPHDGVPGPGAPSRTLRLTVPRGGHRWFEVTCVRDREADDGCLLALRDV